MQAELEELRITVEQAEKARKQADAELQAANDRTNELMVEINEHNKEKRQLEMEGGLTCSYSEVYSHMILIISLYI